MVSSFLGSVSSCVSRPYGDREIERMIAFVDQIVRAIEFLALERISQNGDFALGIHGFHPPDIAVGVTCHCEPQLESNVMPFEPGSLPLNGVG